MRDDTLISQKRLVEQLDANYQSLIVLDCSWYLPAQGRDAKREFASARIPGAQYFDIDEISDPDSSLPHMMPTPHLFAQKMGAMGISETDDIVVYDGPGIFSSARARWMLKAMGATRVRVLEEGFDIWRKKGHPVENGPPGKRLPKIFNTNFDADKVRSFEDLLKNVASGEALVLDARSGDRFSGSAPEPRKELVSGHIPGSFSLPFGSLLDNGTLRPDSELRQILTGYDGFSEKPIITTCGSGVTAAIISLALDTIDHRNHSLYDGSWTDWGQRTDAPIETGE